MEHPRSLRLSLFRLPSITMLPFRNILLPPSLPHVPASDRFIGNLWPFPSAAFPPLTPCLLSTYLPSCLHSSLTICLPPKIPDSVTPSLLASPSHLLTSASSLQPLALVSLGFPRCYLAQCHPASSPFLLYCLHLDLPGFPPLFLHTPPRLPTWASPGFLPRFPRSLPSCLPRSCFPSSLTSCYHPSGQRASPTRPPSYHATLHHRFNPPTSFLPP